MAWIKEMPGKFGIATKVMQKLGGSKRVFMIQIL